MRKIVLDSLLIAILFTSMPPIVDLTFSDNHLNTTENLVDYATSLDSLMVETVDIHNDGTCNLTIEIKMPTTDSLCDLYKEVLNLTHVDLSTNQSIPESVPLTISEPILGANVTNSGLNFSAPARAVKNETLASIAQEQLCCLGIEIIDWTRDYVVEPPLTGELIIHLEAEAQLHSSRLWRNWTIMVGPRNLVESQARASYKLTKFGIIQQMLEGAGFPESTFNHTWITNYILPLDGTLDNGAILNRSWNVDFGNGNELYAEVYEGSPPVGREQVVLLERMRVTNGTIDKTIWEILDQQNFLAYKIFNIHYTCTTCPLGGGSLSTSCEGIQDPSQISRDWSKKWSTTIWEDDFNLSFSYQGVDVILTVYTKLPASWYVGWDVEWWELQWFKAWIKLEPVINVNLSVSFPAEFEYEWTMDLFDWSQTFYFVVGIVPVWADLNVNAAVGIYVNVSATVNIVCGVEASGSFKGGVKWDDGFSLINDLILDVDRIGPYVTVDDIEAWVKPSVTVSVEFMFYSVSGPYVEITPYAYLHLWWVEGLRWWIKVGLDITIGVRFAGWLGDQIDLPSYERNLLDKVFWNETSAGGFVSDVAITGTRILLKGWVSEPVPFSIDILNKGFNEEDVRVDLTAWQGSSWERLESTSVNNLRVGESRTVNFNVTTDVTMPNDTYNFWVEAVLLGGNTDDNASDNTELSSTFLERQNIVVRDMSVTRNETYPGSGYYDVTAEVTVANEGSVNVTALPVWVFYVKNGTSVPVSDVWVENLQWIFNMTPGGERLKQFNWVQPADETDTAVEVYARILPHEIYVLDNYAHALSCRHKSVGGQGMLIRFVVSGFNLMSYARNFTLIIYANNTAVFSDLVFVAEGTLWSAECFWNTTGWMKGYYTITANLPISVHISNEWVFISVLGDVNADKIVDISDIVEAIGGYATDESYEDWFYLYANYDLNSDSIVDITDIVMIVTQFGHSW
ncbi:MAG: hypothetical protein JSV51_04175 [Candidatus Bathyarchaeota archaeon]|nr:MAG: hypothetical protein JSV51_04175 [Candidatus Bathyarchaeota archaeon]